MSTQGWRHERIRGDAYDSFVDKYNPFYSVTDDYPRNLPGLFSWFENTYPILCCTSRISEYRMPNASWSYIATNMLSSMTICA